MVRGLLAAIYVVAGSAHLAAPAGFVAIVPEWVPFPAIVVALTGGCELAGAVGLLTPRWRWLAGVLLAAYAVAVYPANIKHAVDHVAVGGVRLGWVYHAPRLAFQPVLVWWALYAGGVIDWPFRKTGRPRQGRPAALPVRSDRA